MDTEATQRAASASIIASEALPAQQAQALKRLVHDLVQPGRRGHDPIEAVLKAISDQAAHEGITEADIDAELAAYNAERRS